MRILTFTLAAAALTASTALAYDFSAIQQQIMANPAVQQQMVQTVAANPQLLTAAAGNAGNAGTVTNMLANLSPAQQTELGTQIKAITDKLFTPAENAKLTAFQATPEGAGIISKLPQLAQQLAPVLLQMYMAQSPAAAAAPAAK